MVKLLWSEPGEMGEVVSFKKESDESEGRFSAALAMGDRMGEMGTLEWEKLSVGDE